MKHISNYIASITLRQWGMPFDPSDFVHFRKRIGEEGARVIFGASLVLHQDKIDAETEVIIDTTVQEKNITFPTDNKLRLKIIAKTKKFAKRHEIKLKQTYEKEVKELKVKGRFSHHPKRKKEAKRAGKRLKTIAGILVREVGRKDKVGNFETNKALYERILAQKRTSKNKIYSIHEPAVSCIAKGKEHAPYEFGAKTSISILAKIGRSSLPLQKISKRNKGRDFFFARLFSTILDRTTIYSQNFWIFKAKVCALKQTYYELNDFLRVD